MSREMPPLIETWFDSILFNHRLRHNPTGFYVSDGCFGREAYGAFYITTNGNGATLERVYEELQDSAPYIRKLPMSDFEVVTELAPQ